MVDPSVRSLSPPLPAHTPSVFIGIGDHVSSAIFCSQPHRVKCLVLRRWVETLKTKLLDAPRNPRYFQRALVALVNGRDANRPASASDSVNHSSCMVRIWHLLPDPHEDVRQTSLCQPGGLRTVVRSLPHFPSIHRHSVVSRISALTPLYQCYFAVGIWLLFGVEL
jgi:hypothetical protein